MPVEVLELFNLKPGMTVADLTLGMGGHSELIAKLISPGGTLLGLDRDLAAIEMARRRLEPFSGSIRIITRHTEFSRLDEVLHELRNEGEPIAIDAGLIDAGASSMQMDYAPGFSFRRNDYLDGRMNRTGSEPTVADILASSTEQQLAQILWELGDERHSRRIARALVESRSKQGPVTTTGQLVQIIERAVPRSDWPTDKHVATKSMQALRVACNGEMEQLEAGVNSLIDNLVPGGKIAVISFQSQEDRIVKDIFMRRSGRTPAPSGMSIAALAMPDPAKTADLRVITRKPLLPTDAEVRDNPRSRSARLRGAEKI